MLGYVDEATLGAVVRHATVLAYPSIAEGFGLPAIEALAASTTLVTTRGSVMEELVDGVAFLAEPGSADDLAVALADALEESPASRALRHERGQSVAARYTWEACVDLHLETYRAAVAAKRRSVR
jgi:glycosyltransferase involved in cell wall biosynthesis